MKVSELVRVQNVKVICASTEFLSLIFFSDAEGNRKMCLRFDCRKFKPEEITVKTMDDRLSVHAKHVDERPGRRVHHEFTREMTLPKEVDPKKLESHLLQDGVLQIEAPAPLAVQAPKEFTIPIQHMDSKEQIEEKKQEKE